jgi:LAS superfamily LD-carboxypeptidase LdcB
MKPNKDEIVGLSNLHVQKVNFANDFDLHKQSIEPFKELYHLGLKEGFKIKVVSGYRSFERQLNIWNAKFLGKKKLYNLQEAEISVNNLNEEEICRLILLWSALPGTSRHHWGTDLDVIEINAAQAHNFETKLLNSEFNDGGIFFEFYTWLKDNISTFDFFMPYSSFKEGVGIEPWHISHRQVAQKYMQSIDPNYLKYAISNSDIFGKKWILTNIEFILETFVKNIQNAKVHSITKI